MAATVALLLLHTPPAVASPNEEVVPVQRFADPEIEEGIPLTVMGFVAIHPEAGV
jgi:sulfur carrier protein ThiS